MPRTTKTFGSVKTAAPQASSAVQRATPGLATQLVLQKAWLSGKAHLSADEIGVLQRAAGNRAVRHLLSGPETRNRTGLPDAVKANIERLSGADLSSVQVHYNSAQPARLQALAYTQGVEIPVAPGQEQHVHHKAWHVVQRAQGRVRPTLRTEQGAQVNDDSGLEREAEMMGAKALRMPGPEDAAAVPGTGDAAMPLHETGVAAATAGLASSTIQLFPAVLPDKKDKSSQSTAAPPSPVARPWPARCQFANDSLRTR